MEIRYQLAFLGEKHQFLAEIKEKLYHHLDELGVERQFVTILDSGNFEKEYKGNAPLFVIYFGNENGLFNDLDILEKCISRAKLILPVVSDLKRFNDQTPPSLQHIHGTKLSERTEIESLTGFILESFGLLRSTRKLFISYRREQSSVVANQLFDELEKRGFSVYLDTHSNRKGEPFQDELWQRLADSDVMILLNTTDFLKSKWTKEELARANAMKIGILQILWPGQIFDKTTSLTIPLAISDSDFGNDNFKEAKDYLNDAILMKIAEQVEFIRAQTLAARQANLIAEFMSTAKRLGKEAYLHPRKIIQTKMLNGDDAVLIPTIGVPEAFTYHRTEDMVAELELHGEPKLFLLFNHINIKDNWLRHLDWLDKHLPVKGVKITSAEKWLTKL